MTHVFLSLDARKRDTWLAAFPGLIAGTLDDAPRPAALYWLLLPRGRGVDALVSAFRRRHEQTPLVLLADEPAQDEALLALAAGASGYCNGHAAPEVLQQVALAVENGGVWVGQGLMQRLLTATARLLPPADSADAVWRQTLTAREQEAAALLARGASNKEIARQLDITERTVKSHVGAMLEKLGARDRLQLSLIINGVR